MIFSSQPRRQHSHSLPQHPFHLQNHSHMQKQAENSTLQQFIQRLTNPSQAGPILSEANVNSLSKALNNVQQILKMIQTAAPMVQEYGPMIKNLPAMYKMLKAVQNSDSSKETKKLSEEETENNLIDDSNDYLIKNKKEQARPDEEIHKQTKGQSLPRLYF